MGPAGRVATAARRKRWRGFTHYILFNLPFGQGCGRFEREDGHVMSYAKNPGREAKDPTRAGAAASD
jgi:hypothetical protein